MNRRRNPSRPPNDLGSVANELAFIFAFLVALLLWAWIPTESRGQTHDQDPGYWGFQTAPEGRFLYNPRRGTALPGYLEPEPSYPAYPVYPVPYYEYGDTDLGDYNWDGAGFVAPGDGIQRF